MKILVDSVLGQCAAAAISCRPSLPVAPTSSAAGVIVAGRLCDRALSGLLNVLTTYLNTKLELAMTLDFRSDLFQHAQRLSMAYHDQRRSGMLIYIINSHGRRRRPA